MSIFNQFITMKNLRALTVITIVFGLLTGCKSESNTGPATPEWSYNQTIYEVNVRQFSDEGTFKAVEAQLPRLKELGVGILWLMPIHPIGELNRKGSMGSYYSVKDYFDVNPEFGTKQDFQDLVNAIHAHGMYIILDWVANHTAWDNPITTTNPEFFETDENGSFIPPRGTDWDDVIQLDFENRDVWTYMSSALQYWVREFNIDGYRCDVADMVPIAFWNEARADLNKIKPVFMLAEAENPEHHEIAFEMSYSWRMHHLFNSIARGEESPLKLDEYLAEDRARFPSHAFRMQFTSNHDENSWNGTEFERMGEAAKTFAVLASTMEGMPLLYNGQEMGLDRRLAFFEKDAIIWERNEFHDFYAKLFNLNLTNNALFNGVHGGPMLRLNTENDNQIYAFSREKNGNKVIVILNISDEIVAFGLESSALAGTFTNLFDDTTVVLTEKLELQLKPWEYVVYHR